MFIKKIAIFRIAITIVLAIGTVAVVYLTADNPNAGNNGFQRTFLGAILTPSKTITLQQPLTAFAGHNGDSIYLSTPTLGELVSTTTDLNSFHNQQVIKLPSNQLGFRKSTQTIVNDRYVFFFDGSSKNIARVARGNAKIVTYKTDQLFSRAVPIDSGNIFIRKIKKGTADQYFYLLDLDGKAIGKETALTALSKDGGLKAGGTLLYSAKYHHLIYVHYYNNQVLVIDENLRLQLQGKTVDTLSAFQIDSRQIDRGKGYELTNRGPTNFVNRAACENGDHLFVWSLIKADNQTQREFNNGFTIDIYNSDSIQYIGSISIPNQTGKAIRSIMAHNEELFVLSGEKIQSYRLPPLPNNYNHLVKK